MAEMLPAHNLAEKQEYPAGSSSHQYEREVQEDGINSRKGPKPSLAERNRERQQRFRQRQKSRIEELESRCVRLTQQTRTLTSEKEEMAKSMALLKDLVQVRELQIVAVTSRLAQLNTGPNAVKTEIAGLDGTGSIDALLQQQPTVQALEAIQSARAVAQAEVANLQATNIAPSAPAEGNPPIEAAAQEQAAAFAPPASTPEQPGRPSSRASNPQRPRSPQVAFDQLCRVAEIAERQRAGSTSPQKGTQAQGASSQANATAPPTQPPFALSMPSLANSLIQATQKHVLARTPASKPANPPSIFSRMSQGFEKFADVTLIVESQQVVVHSALLAAHSAFFAKKFEEIKHSQKLFVDEQQPIVIDTGSPGKRIQDMELFLRHCYGCLDLGPVLDADIMRLIMVADEFEAKQLLSDCDDAIAGRAQGKKFDYFVELSNGGDMVDWIRLADQIGLAKVSSICEMHLARHLKDNRSGRENTRLNELGQECLLRVINQLAEL